jgi:hypothetical protein
MDVNEMVCMTEFGFVNMQDRPNRVTPSLSEERRSYPTWGNSVN